MSLQVLLQGEGLFAYATLERSLSSVRQDFVFLQIPELDEHFVALGAQETPDSVVHVLVFFQVAGCGEPSWAPGATEGFALDVRPLVSLQVRGTGEAFATS